jgi:hypothetical protein
MTAIVLICAGLLGFSPPDRSEYQAAASKAGRDAGAHLKLAVWCEAQGMDPERLWRWPWRSIPRMPQPAG